MTDDHRQGQPPCDQPEQARSELDDQEDLQEDSSPRITMDWQPRNKRSTYAAVGQLVTLIFMLAALVAIFIFKDRCGEAVSNVIFMDSPDGGGAAQPLAPDPASEPAPPQ